MIATAIPPSAEVKLRPARLADIIGQREAIEQIEQAVNGALRDGRMPGHMLLMGPPGTGKTTIAQAIANELGGSRLVELFGVNLRYPGDITVPLAFSRPRDVVMVDEIHRMSRPVQEILYTVMEDGRLASGSRLSLTLTPLPPLTIVGATTDPQRLTEPMLDRFRLKIRLQPYDAAGLALIAQRAARALGVGITDAAAALVASHGQGTPRIVINLVWAARDWAQPIIDDPTLTAPLFGTTPADAAINLSFHTTGPWADGNAEYAQLDKDAVPGTRWITAASVKQVADSPALVWQLAGRGAG